MRLIQYALVPFLFCHFLWIAANAFALEPMRYDLQPDEVVHYQVVVQIETPFTNDTLAGVLTYTVTDADEKGTTLQFKGGLKSASVDKKDPSKRSQLTMWSVGYEALKESTATLRITKSGEILRLSGDSQMPLGLGHLSTLPFEHVPEDDRQSWTRNSGAWLLSNVNTKTAGKEEIRYTLKQDGKKLVSIDRKYSLTILEVENESYQRTEGEGLIIFNRDLGVIETLHSEQSLVTEADNIQVTFPIKMTMFRMKEEDIAKHQKSLADAEAKKELERTKYIRAIDPEDKKKSMAILRSKEWNEPYRLLRDMRRSVRKELSTSTLQYKSGFCELTSSRKFALRQMSFGANGVRLSRSMGRTSRRQR